MQHGCFALRILLTNLGLKKRWLVASLSKSSQLADIFPPAVVKIFAASSASIIFWEFDKFPLNVSIIGQKLNAKSSSLYPLHPLSPLSSSATLVTLTTALASSVLAPAVFSVLSPAFFFQGGGGGLFVRAAGLVMSIFPAVVALDFGEIVPASRFLCLRDKGYGFGPGACRSVISRVTFILDKHPVCCIHQFWEYVLPRGKCMFSVLL